MINVIPNSHLHCVDFGFDISNDLVINRKSLSKRCVDLVPGFQLGLQFFKVHGSFATRHDSGADFASFLVDGTYFGVDRGVIIGQRCGRRTVLSIIFLLSLTFTLLFKMTQRDRHSRLG